MFHNEIEDITDRIRPFNYEKQNQLISKDICTQTASKSEKLALRQKRKEELFSVNGLQRRPMVNIHGIEPEKPSEKLKKEGKFLSGRRSKRSKRRG